jgi:hypothetical protein
MYEAGTVAFSSVAETNVVGRALYLKVIIESEAKFVPLTVRAKSPPPAITLEGERERIVGSEGGGVRSGEDWELPPQPDDEMSNAISSGLATEQNRVNWSTCRMLILSRCHGKEQVP